MKLDLNVEVHHVARIEGHGNIIVRVKNGKVQEARWDVVETPRYFEVMMKGKHFKVAPLLGSRICGICSISHALAGLRAVENAFGVAPPEQAKKLRLLAKHGETLQSHVLHVLFLAAPDFLGEQSVLPLIESRPDVVQIALRLKGLANRLCDAVAGRTTHPVSLQVGGVARRPKKEELAAFSGELRLALEDLAVVADLYSTLEVPEFTRETEFVSLKGEDGYPFIGGALVSSDGVEKAENEYRSMTNEYVTRENTTKWSKLSRDSYAVGALARFNNNARFLHPGAAELAARFNLRPVCHNPFANNTAQLIECFHAAHESLRLIDELLDAPEEALMADVTPRAGEGVGAVEAPRGLLIHHYAFDNQGYVVKANCVVPSTQNNANIHLDLGSLAAQFAVQGMTDEKLELLCSMLVRAYDPCLSCAVH